MDVVMKEQLVEAGMPAAQADVLASHMPEWPDWSQFATKTDLKELATKADLKELKADLKELELNLRDQLSGLRENMAGLHENMAGLRENGISIQKELASLHLAVADIKRGWLMRFGMPAIITIVTGITGGGLALLLSHLLS